MAELIIVTGECKKEDRESCLAAGAKHVVTFDEMLKANIVKKHTPPKPEDLGTIMYTSGTTGNPKGVKLTHKNLIGTISAALMVPGFQIENNDVHLSYLPLAHIFERTIHVGMYLSAAKIAFASQGSKQLLNDLGIVRPTVFAGVPKVYERIRDAVKGKSTGFSNTLLAMALKAKIADLETGCGYLKIYDALVFSKVKAALGGRCRFMITGGAKISKDTLQFLRVALGPVVQGYGATETSAAATLTLAEDTTLGPVGAPIPCTQIKLVDVPDMNLLCGEESVYEGHEVETEIIKAGKVKAGGEIWIRGAGVSSGYWDPSVDDKGRTVPSNGMSEKNDEEFHLEDGYYWFQTGDAGHITPAGTLNIVGRTKDIFKLSIGEYIAVEKIEQCFNDACSLVDMVFVPKQQKGAKGQDLGYIGCCVVVSDGAAGAVKKWAAENGMADKSIKEIVGTKEFKTEVFEQFKKAGQAKKLGRFELVKKESYMHIEYNQDYPEAWMTGVAVPGGGEEKLLTATQKARRTQLDMYWAPQYEKMYQDE